MASADFYRGSGNGNGSASPDDVIGIVTALVGAPLENGEVASRIGGFEQVLAIEKEPVEAIPNAEQLSPEDLQKLKDEMADVRSARMIAAVFATSNGRHDNYQNGTKFLERGGKRGKQIDPLLPGKYQLNPAMFRVEMVPMLVVEQGQVAVIKSYVGLEEKDISGKTFKFGSIVEPGHKGIWNKTLRTGKYPLNPYCYEAILVPTSIITLNWATNVSAAHKLDARLETIIAKSNEGFPIAMDLVVQIHIPESEAPRIISSVGTLQNLVDEVLQSAVGNYFRDTIQAKKAADILSQRQKIQEEAFVYLKKKLAEYNNVELVAVLVQDVIYPDELTKVLKERQIAVQETETYKAKEAAEKQRQTMEQERGNAATQFELAASKVRIEVATNKAKAREEEGRGEAAYTLQTGQSEAKVIELKQKAGAAGTKAQVDALGEQGPVLTVIMDAIKQFAASQKGVPFMPRTLVTGGSGEGLNSGALTAFMQACQGAANFLPSASSTEEEVVPEETDAPGETAVEETGAQEAQETQETQEDKIEEIKSEEKSQETNKEEQTQEGKWYSKEGGFAGEKGF